MRKRPVIGPPASGPCPRHPREPCISIPFTHCGGPGVEPIWQGVAPDQMKRKSQSGGIGETRAGQLGKPFVRCVLARSQTYPVPLQARQRGKSCVSQIPRVSGTGRRADQGRGSARPMATGCLVYRAETFPATCASFSIPTCSAIAIRDRQFLRILASWTLVYDCKCDMR